MPGLDSLEPLAEALGVAVSELLSGKKLTTEELPKAAGGQIMESMKREHTWKWPAWLAKAAVTVLAVWGIAISTQARRERKQAEQEQTERCAHYTSSVNSNYKEDLAEATADHFQEQGTRTRFNPESLKVREQAAAASAASAGLTFPGTLNDDTLPSATTEGSVFVSYYKTYQKVTTSWAGLAQGAMVSTCITGPLPL